METCRRTLSPRIPIHYDLQSLSSLYADLSSAGFSPTVSKNDFVIRTRKLFHHHDVTHFNLSLSLELKFYSVRTIPSLRMIANHVLYKKQIREKIRNYFYGRLDIDSTNISDYEFLCDAVYLLFHGNDFLSVPLFEQYSA